MRMGHRSQKVIVSEGIEIEFLPPYSPECDASHLTVRRRALDADASAPAERLWQLVDEPLVNQYFETINEIEDILVERCCVVSEMKNEVGKLTNYHWFQYPDCLHTF